MVCKGGYMDHLEFYKRVHNAPSTPIGLEDMNAIIKDSLSPAGENFEGFMNLIIVNEELSECQQEISKYLRGERHYYHLLEEVADVLIAMKYVQEICHIPDNDINRAINVKLDRQIERNLTSEKY